jgi:hypothetical protein
MGARIASSAQGAVQSAFLRCSNPWINAAEYHGLWHHVVGETFGVPKYFRFAQAGSGRCSWR